MTTKTRTKRCGFPGCVEAETTETMCEEHYARWRNSDAWRKAIDDKDARSWFSMGMKEQGMKVIARHRRRWAKQEADTRG